MKLYDEVSIESLLARSSDEWTDLAFQNEPLRFHLDARRMRLLAEETRKDARRKAEFYRDDFLRESYGSFARQHGVCLTNRKPEYSSDAILLAAFIEPNTIWLNKDRIQKAEEKLRQSSGIRLSHDQSLEAVFFAHEFYHFLEVIEPDLFSAAYRITTFSLGPIKNICRVKALSEIGAMEFSKHICGLSFEPWILNSLIFKGN
ncbi:MAG: hypothetical protein ACOX4A_00665 [Saccharofermentanales bacterium]|jgi:hypothetical protein